MTTRIEDGLSQLLRQQFLTEEQQRVANTRSTALQKFFADNFDMAQRPIEMGSYRRGTICRSERDIDLLAPLAPFGNERYWDRFQHDSSRFLYFVRDELNDRYHATAVSSRQVAVKLDFSVIAAEVVPCFPRDGGGYLMPDGSKGWMETNPPFHTSYIGNKDAAQLKQLTPLIRLIKFWNIANDSLLRSFHLELMVANMWAQTILRSRPEAVAATLKVLDSWVARQCPDPWPDGGRVDAYLSSTNRQRVMKMLAEDATRIERAEGFVHYGQHEQAFAEWDRVYRGKFPGYG